MHSRVDSDLRCRAGVCLRAVLVGALGMMALPALAAGHPERHLTVSHRVTRRAVVETESRPARKKSAKRKAKARIAVPEAKSSTHARKSRRRRAPQDDADNDPPIIYRAAAKKQKANAAPAPRLADVKTPDEPKTATPDDFARAAGTLPAMPETGERGQSHPDDDERLPVVSAAPEPVTPVGKPTLAEKLKSDSVAAKDLLTRRPASKPSLLPEDHAAKVAVIEEAIATPLPKLYSRRGKLIVPPPMKGSWDILVHQNTMADSEGLDRIQDDDDLNRMRATHLLVPVQNSAGLLVNADLPLNRRYARPWAARFAADTARAFYARFHQPLRLNSAVRTVDYQLRLQRVNGNAAAVDGDGASPHLTGQALDFGKRGMSMAQIAWMRAYLAPLMQMGKLDVEEEFQQACFHISVYRSYMPSVKAKAAAKVEVAQLKVPVVRARGGR
jgi:hypothetical protein